MRLSSALIGLAAGQAVALPASCQGYPGWLCVIVCVGVTMTFAGMAQLWQSGAAQLRSRRYR